MNLIMVKRKQNNVRTKALIQGVFNRPRIFFFRSSTNHCFILCFFSPSTFIFRAGTSLSGTVQNSQIKKKYGMCTMSLMPRTLGEALMVVPVLRTFAYHSHGTWSFRASSNFCIALVIPINLALVKKKEEKRRLQRSLWVRPGARNVLRRKAKAASSKTNALLFMVYFNYDHLERSLNGAAITNRLCECFIVCLNWKPTFLRTRYTDFQLCASTILRNRTNWTNDNRKLSFSRSNVSGFVTRPPCEFLFPMVMVVI